MHERRTTARIMLLALIGGAHRDPAAGSRHGLVYVADRLRCAVLRWARRWNQLAGLVALFAVVALIVLVAAPAVGVHVLKGYQKQRLTTFITPARLCPAQVTPTRSSSP